MDLKEIKAILRLMEGNDVEELEFEDQGRRVRIRRRSGTVVAPQPAAAPLAPVLPQVAPATVLPAAAAPAAPASPETSGLIPIQSPMVGTFYRAPAPGADPYVKEGDVIHKGTVLCIIEAMKLMNEIEAEVKGRISKILVENAQPVEFGQNLFLVEPV
jgi:acetyl-CoA carboxylase biotin carboxyl carrier protein